MSLIVNNCSTLNIRRDKHHYRLDFYINKNKIYNLELNKLISKVTKDLKFYYDVKNNKYYLHGKNVIKLLELFEQLNIINYLVPNNFNNKVAIVLNNKQLFTRSSGKKLTEEELIALEQLSKEISAKIN